MTHKQALDKLDTLSNLSEVEELINEIYAHFDEQRTYVISDPLDELSMEDLIRDLHDTTGIVE